jgi:hypothetical protein
MALSTSVRSASLLLIACPFIFNAGFTVQHRLLIPSLYMAKNVHAYTGSSWETRCVGLPEVWHLDCPNGAAGYPENHVFHRSKQLIPGCSARNRLLLLSIQRVSHRSIQKPSSRCSMNKVDQYRGIHDPYLQISLLQRAEKYIGLFIIIRSGFFKAIFFPKVG